MPAKPDDFTESTPARKTVMDNYNSANKMLAFIKPNDAAYSVNTNEYDQGGYGNEYANTTTSPKDLDKVTDGIYQRFFTEDEIAEEQNPPANKNTNTIYYYFLREVGGIATHAYNDGRYENMAENPYYNSNNTAESYLFEMGYLDNVQDLRNIQSNKEGYAKGVVTALQEYLK